ncbi:Carbohydrate kinase PfkB [Dillenia turbinata]|uniref:Carbohydrate kinase PfkB n=1 Tax=Dillenia turbinata TaxID=194707 RepID=A0AAN8VV24_9MAGN
MHNPTLTLKPSVPSSHGFSLIPQNRSQLNYRFCTSLLPNNGIFSILNCNSTKVHNSNSVKDGKLTSIGVKDVDVATLGNLCVDIVLNVPELPPATFDERKAYMEQLSASPPDKRYWEAGGNCNMVIAAARLGLRCITIGHVGDEIYGQFLLDVLHDEEIGFVGMTEYSDLALVGASYETLLCWVLVDPLQRHGFCSRADFHKEPAFSWLSGLSREVKKAIKNSKILFCNGYGFDELSPSLITSAIEYAVEVGTAIFFDPGPRGKTLSAGTPEQKRALGKFLKMSDVLLLTSDEAESLTGIQNPILAGQELLRNAERTKWVIVKMGSKGSLLITPSSISCAPAFKVNVVDTVGCGDSFVAAIAFGFLHNMPNINTLAIANAVGAATAMGCGAGRNVATLKQVTELLKDCNLNEDGQLWQDLLHENLEAHEVTFLSKTAINGNDNCINHVALEKVASELHSKLEPARKEAILNPSCDFIPLRGVLQKYRIAFILILSHD